MSTSHTQAGRKLLPGDGDLGREELSVVTVGKESIGALSYWEAFYTAEDQSNLWQCFLFRRGHLSRKIFLLNFSEASVLLFIFFSSDVFRGNWDVNSLPWG